MISLVIPHMPSLVTDAALDRCVESFKGQYDELIIIVNDGIGYGPAVNLGLKYAKGDYLVVSNNDITLEEGELKSLKLCPYFGVPIINPIPRDYQPRCFFGMHRHVYEFIMQKDGFFYDPIFKTGYFEDDDLIKRLKNHGFHSKKMQLVKINHLDGGGLTMKAMGEQRWFDINQKVFNEKWSQDTYSSPYSYPSESSER